MDLRVFSRLAKHAVINLEKRVIMTGSLDIIVCPSNFFLLSRGYLPSSPRQATLDAFLFTPKYNLQNRILTFSISEVSHLFRLSFSNAPQISELYNKMGEIIE